MLWSQKRYFRTCLSLQNLIAQPNVWEPVANSASLSSHFWIGNGLHQRAMMALLQPKTFPAINLLTMWACNTLAINGRLDITLSTELENTGKVGVGDSIISKINAHISRDRADPPSCPRRCSCCNSLRV